MNKSCKTFGVFVCFLWMRAAAAAASVSSSQPAAAVGDVSDISWAGGEPSFILASWPEPVSYQSDVITHLVSAVPRLSLFYF